MIWRALSQVAPGQALTVLFFHRVFAERDALMPGEPTAADFDRLLAWLGRQYRVMRLDEAVQLMAQRRLPRGVAAITFDDGYRDNHDVAAPVLEKHGMPATFFITTGYIDGGTMWNDAVAEAVRGTRVSHLEAPELGLPRLPLGSWPERSAAHGLATQKLKYLEPAARAQAVADLVARLQAPVRSDLMMTREQVRQLRQRGFQIGAHTVSHPILTRLDDAEAFHEIQASRQTLESWLGERVGLFAYPNGRDGSDFDQRHRRMAQQAGFDAAFSTEPAACGPEDDRYALPRYVPWRRDSGLRFGLDLWRNQWRKTPARPAADA